MKIELTTRQLMNMLKTAYKAGVKIDPADTSHVQNSDGMAQSAAQNILLAHLYEEDYLLQQT